MPKAEKTEKRRRHAVDGRWGDVFRLSTVFRVISAVLALSAIYSLPSTSFAQQPGPIFAVNAKGVQGVGPGNWPKGQDKDLYVSPSASDTTGDGSSGNPYRTISRALQDVPAFVTHHYTIHLAAGTYREQVDMGGRFFGTHATSNFKQASVELQGDTASPDSYVISGADAGNPTVPVRDYAVVCSFANCILRGISLQYAAKGGFLQQGGVSVIYQSSFRHFTSADAKGIMVYLNGISELRGNSTVSDVTNGIELDDGSLFFGYYAPIDYLHTGFPVNTTFTVTGLTTGVGIGVYDRSFYSVSNTTSISGTGAAGSRGILVGTHADYDTETTTITDCETAVYGEVFSWIEINTPSFTNAATGVRLRKQAFADWLSGDPTFTNVTTPYNLTEGSWVTSPTVRLFDGSATSTGPFNISAGGTNQNITLTPSGTGIITTPSKALQLNDHVVVDWLPRDFELLSNYDYATDTHKNPSYSSWDLYLGGGPPDAEDAFALFRAPAGGGALNWSRYALMDKNGWLALGSAFPTQKVDVQGGSVVAALNTVGFSSTPTFDAALGNTQKITLGGDVTSSTLSNATAGEQINFLICQDATGNRTFVWPSNVKGGMTIGFTASKCSAQIFIFDGTNAYALSPGVANM
jgi:hypothetical protein